MFCDGGDVCWFAVFLYFILLSFCQCLSLSGFRSISSFTHFTFPLSSCRLLIFLYYRSLYVCLCVCFFVLSFSSFTSFTLIPLPTDSYVPIPSYPFIPIYVSSVAICFLCLYNSHSVCMSLYSLISFLLFTVNS